MADAVNIELFSCSGGMAEGFRRAGIEFDFVFDYDPDACASYGTNLGKHPVRIDVRDLVRMARAGWSFGRIDLLVADPPCTPWSRAGKRLGTEDERDMLEETAELITLMRPRAYLIGNVPGLQDSTSWHVVQRVIGGLSKHGYCVADYAVLDAADYGVPQHRVRPFWYGHLDGPCVRWPTPTHGDASHPSLPGMELQPWVTCRAALSHLPVEQLGRPVRLKRREEQRGYLPQSQRHSLPDEPSLTIVDNGGRGGARGSQALLLNKRHVPAQLDEPAQTIGAKYRGQHEILDVTEPLANHPFSTPDEPSMTIKCNGGRASQASSTLMLDERAPDHHRVPESGDTPSRTIVTTSGITHLLDADATKPKKRVTRVAPDDMVHTHSIRGDAEAPAGTVVCEGRGGGASGTVMRTGAWPWNRPATTVEGAPTLAPFGRDGRAGEHQRHHPNAIVLSERAAAILQGFPEGWTFHGKTKKARWAQLGMAMPPALAEAVARSIRAAMEQPPVAIAAQTKRRRKNGERE